LIYTSEPHVTTLKNLGLLNPILFILQEAVAFDYVGIAPIKSGTGITLKATRGGDFIMLAAETRSFVACARDMRDMSALVRSSVRFTLETGNTPPDILQVPVSVAALKKAVVKQRQIPLAQVDDHHGGSKKDWYIPGIQAFSWHKHVALLDTVYPAPDIEGPRIAFFVPWLRLGGVDQCVTQLARNIRQIDCKANLLLILTDENSVTNDEAYALFDEIVPVAHIGEERRSKVCEVIASHCDLSINAHSTTAYKSLRLRHAKPKSLKFGRAFSYLHVIDEDTFGKPCGHAMEAANRDVMLDGHIVISNHMRSFLINKGVHSNRIVVAPNAPIVTPASHEEALALADEKSEVDYSSARPLRILFAGRLDHQKGLERLVETIRLSHQAKLNARFTILGSAVMSRTIPLFSQTQNCEILPATHDRAQLLTHFQETDVFLLLSRWEGVPLSILDAMACGAVVVATDVGAVSEVVHGNVNGYLIRNGDDKTVATQALDLLRMIIHNSAGCTNIRRAAVATAFSRSWRDTAETILGLVRAQ
jgi:glycosyltransferase involved in cell wall biosynthesis